MFENYPFWYTFFTKLGYRVVLSPQSSRKIYELGIESIPSESECYPAKLAHGHVTWLIKQGVKFIFYPCVPYEHKEIEKTNNHYNCPIVTSYAENIKNNVEELKDKNITFLNPFLPFDQKNLVETILALPEFKRYNFTKKELTVATRLAEQEYQKCRADIHAEGQKAVEFLEKNHKVPPKSKL